MCIAVGNYLTWESLVNMLVKIHYYMWFKRKNHISTVDSGSDWKSEIRVFISSTFADMQEERDAIIKEFNHLKIEASKRGVSIVVVDLRWGVTEAESGQGRVVDICLKEINKSKPFFIGLVGDHYGSVPPICLSDDAELSNQYPDVVDEIKNGKSYTEIEMQYGVLDNPDTIDAFFYIKRENEDTDNDNRLKLLKDKIIQQKRYPVHVYCTIEDITSQINKDFMDILHARYRETRIFYDDEVKYQQSIFKDRLLDFYFERESLIESIKVLVEKDSINLIQITGPSGSGKSATCARIVEEYTSNERFKVSYYFAGIGSSYEDLLDVVSSLLGQRISYEEADKVISENVIADECTRLIVIDGLDSLNLKDTAPYGLSWLSLLPANYKVVVSVTSDSFLNKLIVSQKNVGIIECPPLEMMEKLSITIEYFQRISKRLEDSQLECIISNPITSNPAVLRILLDELSVFGYYERLGERIGSYLDNRDVDDFYYSVLARIENDFNKDDVKAIFQSLILSRSGLAEDDILDICHMTRLDLSMLLSNCPSIVNNYGSLVRVTTNNRIKAIFNELYLGNSSEASMRRRICDYFYDKCRGYKISFYQYDNIKCNFSCGDTSRAVHEVAFQLYNMHDYQSLYDFLIVPSFFEILFRIDRALLYDSWKTLQARGFTLDSILDCKDNIMIDKYLIPVFYNDLGRFAMIDMKNFKLSQICYERCMTNGEAPFMRNSTSLKIRQAVITNQAIAASKAKDYAQALNLFKEALNIKLSIPDFIRGGTEIASGFKNLAIIQKIVEHFDEAIINFKKALDIYRGLYKGVNQDVADTLFDLAYCYYMSNDYIRAYKAYSEAYDMYCVLEDNNSENVILSQFGMGRSLVYANKLTEALDTLNGVLSKSIAACGEEADVTKDIYYVLGYLWEKISITLQDEATVDTLKSFVENSATCYVHANYYEDAQRMIDKYNSL